MPLPVFLALPKDAVPSDFQPILDALAARAPPPEVELSGDAWARIVGADAAPDYERFVRHVSQRGADGRFAYAAIVVPGPELGAATGSIVAAALGSGLPVVGWDGSTFRRVSGLERLPGRNFKRWARVCYRSSGD